MGTHYSICRCGEVREYIFNTKLARDPCSKLATRKYPVKRASCQLDCVWSPAGTTPNTTDSTSTCTTCAIDTSQLPCTLRYLPQLVLNTGRIYGPEVPGDHGSALSLSCAHKSRHTRGRGREVGTLPVPINTVRNFAPTAHIICNYRLHAFR